MTKRDYILLILLALVVIGGAYTLIPSSILDTNTSEPLLSTKELLMAEDEANIYAEFPNKKIVSSIGKNLFHPKETIWYSGYLIEDGQEIADSLFLSFLDNNGVQLKQTTIEVENNEIIGNISIPESIVGNCKLVLSTDRLTQNIVDQKYIKVETRSLEFVDISFNYLFETHAPGDKVIANLTIYDKNNQKLKDHNIRYTVVDEKGILITTKTKSDSLGNAIISFKLPDTLRSNLINLLLRINSKDGISKSNIRVPVLSEDSSNIDLKFYPKNGEIFKGIPNKIAIRAYDDRDFTSIEGFVIDKYGKHISTFTTDETGTGILEITPTQDDYRIILTHPWGVRKSFKLPKPLEGANKILVDTIFG